jgi:hypothetical protein
MTIDALAAAAGPLRADAAGVITVNNLTTVDNTIPRFDGTAALFQNSTAVIDDNENMLIGGANPGASATKTLTLRPGTAATASGVNDLSIGARNTGSGIVLALFGGSDGGISASTTNTITNKISIYVNGTGFFFLAGLGGA